jgi:hypothetical protein
MSISRVGICSLFLFILTGCVGPDYFRSQPTSQLCMNYLTLPSANFNHASRAAELRRRGEDCSAYMAAANTRIKADAAFDNFILGTQQNLNNIAYPPSSTPVSPGGIYQRSIMQGHTKVCLYDHLGSIKSITVSAVSICPL